MAKKVAFKICRTQLKLNEKTATKTLSKTLNTIDSDFGFFPAATSRHEILGVIHREVAISSLTFLRSSIQIFFNQCQHPATVETMLYTSVA